jgi:hypothetical protein
MDGRVNLMLGYWRCDGCTWAGDQYEQGVADQLLEDIRYNQQVLTYDWKLLQHYLPQNTGFTLHFAGDFKSYMTEYIKTQNVS